MVSRGRKRTKRRRKRGRRARQKGRGVDIQKLLNKTGIEFHWPGYQYMGPGTKLNERLARGDPGINRLDRLAKQHDIDYSRAKTLREKHAADRKMIAGIRAFKKKSLTKHTVNNIMKAKLKMKL